jgi:hypothetical protein
MDEMPVWQTYGLPNPGQASPEGMSAGQGQMQPLTGGQLQPKQGNGAENGLSTAKDAADSMGGKTGDAISGAISGLPTKGNLIGELLKFL